MNNYDMSSSGIDIELCIGYNSSIARENWCESFESFNEDSDIYIYTPMYEPSKVVDFYDLYEVEKPRLGISIRILLQEFGYEGYTSGYNKDRAWEEVSINIDLTDIDMYERILEEYGVKYKKLYDEVVTRGYSQGDWAKVLLPHYLYDDFRLEDNIDLGEYFKQDIDSKFWDQPLSAMITIDGVNYYSEMFDGLYEVYGEQCWDKYLFINEVIKEFDQYDEKILRAELEELVPDEIEEYL